MRHDARLGVDRRDRLLQEADAGLRDVAVRNAHGVHRRAAEHHVELRVAEDECLGLVDQRHVDLVAELLRQDARELEAPEAGTENDDASSHASSVSSGNGSLQRGGRWPRLERRNGSILRTRLSGFSPTGTA